MSPYRVWAGEPFPLGATWDGLVVEFALFAPNATRVGLCLDDAAGRLEVGRVDLPGPTDGVWHGNRPDIGVGQLYGCRVHGPHEPQAGHRLDPTRLLLDPYAKRLSGTLTWSDAHHGYRIGHWREDLSLDRRDTAAAMRTAVVVDHAFTGGAAHRPRTCWHGTVIPETPVKGMTRPHPALPQELRGTDAGLAHPAVIDHLLRRGDGGGLALLAKLGPTAGRGFERPAGEPPWVSGPGARGELARGTMPARGVALCLGPRS
jgi:glycogen operon protein